MSPSPPSPSETNNVTANVTVDKNVLSLVDAMEAADRIRKVYLELKNPSEAKEWFPPGTLQGVSAFATTGLLMTPLRGSLLKMTGPKGPFQGFMDLVITPILAVGAAQMGLVIGTLYGSSHYLQLLATNAATRTKTVNQFGKDEVLSVQIGVDDTVRYSPTTANAAAERDAIVSRSCDEVLKVSQSKGFSLANRTDFAFGSWDPRTTTMQNLWRAVENCRRQK